MGSMLFWECVEFSALGIVLVGVIGEYLAEFSYSKSEADKKRFAKISTRILIAGLALEIIGTVRTTQIGNKEIAGLNLEAANAREAAAELEARIQPRKLTLEQLERITVRWQRFSSHKVILVSYVFDAEADSLCEQIKKAFSSAGIVTEAVCGTFASGPPLAHDVEVWGPLRESEFVHELSESLRSEGNLMTHVKISDDQNVSANTVQVTVGVKSYIQNE